MDNFVDLDRSGVASMHGESADVGVVFPAGDRQNGDAEEAIEYPERSKYLREYARTSRAERAHSARQVGHKVRSKSLRGETA